MRMLLAIQLFVLSASIQAAVCPNFSGSYRFEGFNAQSCRINRSDSLHLSPMPLGSHIAPGDVVRIQQKSCDSIAFSYADSRYSNTRGILETHAISLVGAQLNADSIRLETKQKYDACHLGSCLKGNEKTSWVLSLEDNGDLDFTFKNKFIGAYNLILPVVEVVKARCQLVRVN